jgi:hypothetical protein
VLPYHLDIALISLAVGSLALRTVGILFRRWAVSYFTVVPELNHLGTPRQDGKKLGGTAVICGGRYVSVIAYRTLMLTQVGTASLGFSLRAFVQITLIRSSSSTPTQPRWSLQLKRQTPHFVHPLVLA